MEPPPLQAAQLGTLHQVDHPTHTERSWKNIRANEIERSTKKGLRTAGAAAKKSSAEPHMYLRWAAHCDFWLPDEIEPGAALHHKFASLGNALAGFVTDASGPPQREPREQGKNSPAKRQLRKS